MCKSPRLPYLALLLTTVAACTQAPAGVEYKGQNTYGPGATSSYAASQMMPSAGNASASTPVYGSPSVTETSASVQPIGVNDLTPPAPGKGAMVSPVTALDTSVQASNVPAGSPFQKAHADAPKMASAGPINLWTNKPHETDAQVQSSPDTTVAAASTESFNLRPKGQQASNVKPQMVSDVKKTDQVVVAQLDNIIGNDGGSAVGNVAAPTNSKSQKTEAVASTGFMWPVNSKKIISEFGPKGNGIANDGINIASAEGEPVWAAADGEVVYVGNELQGYGNMVLIKHSGGKTTSYAHMSRATVDKYDRIKQGDIIGYVGSSGNVKEPQLHFAIHNGKDPVDPLKYLNRNVASLH